MSKTTKRPRRRKSTVIEEAGVRLRMFARKGVYWLDVRDGEKRQRVSLKTSDEKTATERAKDIATEVAKAKLLGVKRPDTISIGALFQFYLTNKTLTAKQKRNATHRQRLFLGAWDASLLVAEICQTHVDQYVAHRRAAHIAKQRHLMEHPTPQSIRRTEVRPLRDGALQTDFSFLASVFNFATKHKLASGERLLQRNPLHDCVTPREKSSNRMRPVASVERYRRLVDVADTVDPTGRFKVALAIAWGTGRRLNAILHLRVSDLLLTTAQVRQALADLGRDSTDADAWTHGAILWKAANDKMRTTRVSPINRTTREAIDVYLAKSMTIGDRWLVPATRKPEKPLAACAAQRWLVTAERVAELPHVRGGAWHAFRRGFATHRRGVVADKSIAVAGGWESVKVMTECYQGYTAADELAAVEAA